MKKLILLISVNLFLAVITYCQSPSKLRESAKSFTNKGDYNNALLLLNRAIQLDPNDLQIIKDLAITEYMAGKITEAETTIKPALEREDADVTVFQIAAMVYKEMEAIKELEKLYKKGLKKFPESGPLHYEFGEYLLAKKDNAEAIKTWEEGIELDPSYPGNYYHASKFYFYNRINLALALIYSEIFINQESLTNRTVEIKSQLLETYKLFYTDASVRKSVINLPPFSAAVYATLEKQLPVAYNGITAETLTMIRTRFLLDWFQNNASTYPFKLFDQHQYLLREGMFEAYNQWLFGPVSNIVQYKQWTVNNPQKVSEFTEYQQNWVFKMPPGQYYK